MDRKYEDILERAGWTAAQAAVSVLVVEVSDLRMWWALPIATALSAAKTWIVSRESGKTESEGTPSQEAQ